jgi:hypothetical protein
VEQLLTLDFFSTMDYLHEIETGAQYLASAISVMV